MANRGRYRDGSRSSIGDEYVNLAIQKIDSAMLKDIASATPALDIEYCTSMLFRDEDIELIKKAAPLLHSAGRYASYSMRPHVNADISFGFDDHPAPSTLSKHFQPERAEEFLQVVQKIEEARRTWGLVKYVLRWLNQNATPGAIRALWPSILQLCPAAPVFKELQHSPVRYTTPHEVGPMLQMFRETATTVAMMGMMPDGMKARPTKGVYLQFPFGGFTHDNGIIVRLDGINIGLGDE